METLGSLVDKLIIENIKIYFVRERLHTKDLTDKEYTELTNMMNSLNKNRDALASELDEKFVAWVTGKEKMVLFKRIKTYGLGGKKCPISKSVNMWRKWWGFG